MQARGPVSISSFFDRWVCLVDGLFPRFGRLLCVLSGEVCAFFHGFVFLTAAALR